MRVLVAGSSGLIGTALVPHLRAAGHEVLRLVRRDPRAPDERGWDPPSGRLDDGALDGVDAAVNLCGVGVGDRRWSGAYKQAIRDSRMIPTDVLARAVVRHRVPALVNASGVNYYGDTGERPVDESAPAGTGFLAEVCRDWEGSTAPAEQGGARVVLARSGPVLSPAGGLLGRLRPLFAALLGGKLGDGRQYLSWISLDDEVAALRFAVEHGGLHGPVNLTAPYPVTNAEFTQALARALGRPAPWTIPPFALKIVLGSELAEEAALSGQRVLPAALQRAGFRFHHPTIDAALAAALSP